MSAKASCYIYIRHADDKGIQYNVELATRAFPGTGSLSTLTYTTDEAIQSGISMRTLNTKEAVALTLVYLAKGYQYKYHKTDTFLISCATTTLQYDSLNLNALLLKAEVLENELLAQNKAIAQLKNNKTFNDYEQLIIKLYNLGYREMPVAMKHLVLNALKQDGKPIITKNHAPKPFKDIDDKIQYATLSHGLFEEIHIDKPYEQYSSTLFNTKTKIITKFIHKDTLIDNYNFDPVVFALSIDPLAAKYPSMSPYAAFENNPIYYVDPDGRSGVAYKTDHINKSTGRPILRVVSNYSIYGDAVTKERKCSIEDDLNNNYNNGFTFKDKDGTIYDVVFEFKVEIIDASQVNSKMKELNAENNFVEVRADVETSSYLTGRYGGNAGVFKTSNIDDNIGTASHEANHGFGGKNHPEEIRRVINEGDDIDITIPKGSTYSSGEPINMSNRKVTQQNITDILNNVSFDESGKGDVGTARPHKYDKVNGFIDVRKE